MDAVTSFSEINGPEGEMRPGSKNTLSSKFARLGLRGLISRVRFEVLLSHEREM